MRTLALLFACVAGLLAAAAATAMAADQPAEESKREPGSRLQELAARLELTEDQKEQIAPILEKEIADLKQARDDASLRRGQRLRRVRDITEAASKEIRALLTPEQQTEYDALRKEMRGELKQRAKERKDAAN